MSPVRYLRAKGNSIEGGASEILRNTIAERILGLPPRTPGRQGRRIHLEQLTDLLYWDTEEALRDTVRLFADRCPPESVTSAYDAAPQDFSDVSHTLATDLGMAGLLVPAARWRGRRAVPVRRPWSWRRSAAPSRRCHFCPARCWPPSRCWRPLRTEATETVKGLAANSLTGALVVPLPTAPDDAVVGVSAGGNGLTGRITSVAGAR